MPQAFFSPLPPSPPAHTCDKTSAARKKSVVRTSIIRCEVEAVRYSSTTGRYSSIDEVLDVSTECSLGAGVHAFALLLICCLLNIAVIVVVALSRLPCSLSKRGPSPDCLVIHFTHTAYY